MSLQSNAARNKLIEIAATLVYHQGWNATGINQILTESRVPKGSFYYYFQSKDDLGVAIVKFHAQKIQDSCKRTLLDDGIPGSAAIRKFFEERIVELRQGEWRYGCPIGSFSNEVAASTEKIAQACRESFEDIEKALVVAIVRGQKDRTILASEDPKNLANALSSVWQGAMLNMKTFRSEEPLRLALDWIFRGIFLR